MMRYLQHIYKIHHLHNYNLSYNICKLYHLNRSSMVIRKICKIMIFSRNTNPEYNQLTHISSSLRYILLYMTYIFNLKDNCTQRMEIHIKHMYWFRNCFYIQVGKVICKKMNWSMKPYSDWHKLLHFWYHRMPSTVLCQKFWN